MNFIKRVNGSWTDIPYYVHNTDTDTIATLPAVLYPTGTTATVGLKGNMSQSGTPTPTTPIQPSEYGERTGNLAPPLTEWVDGYIIGGVDGGNLHTPTASKEKASDFIEVLPNTTYTFSFETGNFIGGKDAWRVIAEYNERKEYITRPGGAAEVKQVLTTSSSTKYLRLSYRSFDSSLNTMLNAGSTALPYEPWGIKIPISSANTTTPVYLGEVHTTRKVKKYECTGDENWRFFSDSTGEYGAWQFYVDNAVNGLALSSALSNIAEYGATASTRSRYPYGVYLVASGTGIAFQMAGAKDIFPSVTAWKFYLAQQYANGTPVTIWYVLAKPTTGIVNEPIRKIGDYADTVSGISIPTITGKDTFDVLTTLKPSEVELTYTGWHDATVKEWDGSEWEGE